MGEETTTSRRTSSAVGLLGQPRGTGLSILSGVAAEVDPFVEYDNVAARFGQWRGGRPGALDRWGQAVQPFLPARSVTVGDIGAGTGVFSRAWPGWADAAVVGIEPSAAMLASARSTGVPPRYLFVRGIAEALPVASGRLDIAWVSTAFHHFSDRQHAAYELRRALVDDGVVLMRGLLPDRASEGWWSVFLGYEKNAEFGISLVMPTPRLCRVAC
jgi:SAM-dependent methyltransferase